MGSVLLMGVTLAVGFAVWAWASNAAISSEKSFGNSIGINSNCLNLGLVIVNANFSSTNANLVTLWFYNNGHGAVNLTNIMISNSTTTYVSNMEISRTNLTEQVLTQNVKSMNVYFPSTFSKSAIYTFQAEVHNESLVQVSKTSSYYSYQCGIVSAQYQQVTPSVL
jgi:hypothetical protein